MSRKGLRNGKKRPRSSIQGGKTVTSAKHIRKRGVSKSTKGIKKNNAGKKDVQSVSRSLKGNGKRVDVVTHVTTENNIPTKKSEPDKKIGKGRKITISGKIKSARAYKSHIMGRRSSNARNLSDEELRELGRIPGHGNRPRLRVVAANAGYVKATEGKKEREKKRTVRRQVFKKSELIHLYFKNESFRRVFNDGNYIYADGYFCIYSDECLEYKDGQFHIKDNVKDITEYCISLQEVYEVKSGKKGALLSSTAHPAPNKNKSKDPTTMRYFIENDGPDMYYTYGDALSDYMGRWHYTCYDMESLTYISSKSIERYCENKHLPDLPYSVAICIALKLIPDESFEMISLSKNILDFRTEIGKAYKYLLYVSNPLELTVQDCNNILIKEGFAPMTEEK